MKCTVLYCNVLFEEMQVADLLEMYLRTVVLR